MTTEEVSNQSTIVAVATPPGVGGVAVVRVSGPLVNLVVQTMARSGKSPLTQPRTLVYCEIVSPGGSDIIDRALVVYFPAPHSFTGEEVLEFHLHGSPLIAQLVIKGALACGVVPAQPGEFTKRAYLNGKIDLLQAEAIGQIIAASSERALYLAQEHLGGRLSRVLLEIADPLRDLLAEVEASLDFPDEELITPPISRLRYALTQVITTLGGIRNTYGRGRVVRQGIRVLLLGRPNVGKSSLLNMVLGNERAIVSDIAGTTRDTIEETCFYDGYALVLCDAAGVRDSVDPIERQGVERTRERLGWADLVLLVDESPAELALDSVLGQELSAHGSPFLRVLNKCDLLNAQEVELLSNQGVNCVSAKNGDGIESLLQRVVKEVVGAIDGAVRIEEGDLMITEQRHYDLLGVCSESLARTGGALDSGLPLEVVSAELRYALRTIEELVGRTETEDILGRIFSKYCIGK